MKLHWMTSLSVLQLITSYSVRARLDIILWDPNNQWVLGDLYLACNFPLTTTSVARKLCSVEALQRFLINKQLSVLVVYWFIRAHLQ